MKKKIIIILSVILVVALVATGVGIYAYIYGQQDHADAMDSDDRYEYNYILTLFGRNNSLSGDDEVLVLESVDKTLGGDTEATFKIYRYEKESDLSAALKMTVEEIAENGAYEYVGYGTVTLVDDSFAGMSNMKTIYVK